MPIICGIDEAGRGPLAGPVTAAAVILPQDFPREGLRDSKKMTEKQRQYWARELMSRVPHGVGWVSAAEIDRMNIHRASLLAMARAYEALGTRADYVLVDGKFYPDLDTPGEAVIKGDDRIVEISAASIICKYLRDLWMIRYSWIERLYGFEVHKGYPTASHRRLLKEQGPCAIHRRSFRPVQEELF